MAYPRRYKIRLVNPDGSSYMIRHLKPIGLIKLPVDPSSLSREEKKARIKRLKYGNIEKDETVEEFNETDVKFDQRALAKLIRRKRGPSCACLTVFSYQV